VARVDGQRLVDALWCAVFRAWIHCRGALSRRSPGIPLLRPECPAALADPLPTYHYGRQRQRL